MSSSEVKLETDVSTSTSSRKRRLGSSEHPHSETDFKEDSPRPPPARVLKTEFLEINEGKQQETEVGMDILPIYKTNPWTMVKFSSKSAKSKVMVMSNDLVLAKIAEKLPVGQLLSLRLTCPLWSRNFVPNIQKRHSFISFGDLPHNEAAESEWTSPPERRPVTDFIEILQSSSNIPFTKFSFFYPKPDLVAQFPDFISTFGSKFTALHMGWLGSKQHNILPVSDLRKIIFDWTPEITNLILIPSPRDPEQPTDVTSLQPVKLLPKLKRVKVLASEHGLNENDEVANPRVIQLIVDVVQCAVGLQRLELFDDSVTNNWLRPTLNALLHGACHLQLQQLKTLKVTSLEVLDIQILLQLTERALHLEAFSICINPLHVPEDYDAVDEELNLLHKFLISQSPTMKKLIVHFDTFESNDIQSPPIYIPSMDKLVKLKIVFATQPVELHFGNKNEELTFANAFPLLRKFSVKMDKLFSGSFEQYAHSEVTTLKMEVDPNEYGSLTKFSSVFPAVTRLELILTLTSEVGRESDLPDEEEDEEVFIDSKEFAKLWTTWPGLTSLQLDLRVVASLDLDLDAFLTGVPRTRIEPLRLELGTWNHSGLTLESLFEMLEDKKIRPSISDLKHLREFSIKGNDTDENKPKLTDIGGYLGIALASSSLQRVVINGHGENFISEDCRDFIKSTFGPLAEISL